MNQTTTRRLACDRCRDQKLRCPRDEQAAQRNETCGRCLRAGAVCTSSSPHPLGRPRLKPNPDVQQSGQVRKFTSSRSAGHGGRRVLGTQSRTIDKSTPILAKLGNNHPDLQPLTSPSKAQSAAMASLPSADHSMEQAWTPPPSSGYQFGFPFNEDHSAFLDPFLSTTGTSNDNSGVLQHISSGTQQSSSRPVSIQGDGMCPSVGRDGEYDSLDGGNPSIENDVARDRPSSDTADVFIGLSRLNESLVSQLDRIDSYPWGRDATHGLCVDKIYDIDGNPAAQVLQSTSEFIAILERLTQCPLHHTVSSSHASMVQLRNDMPTPLERSLVLPSTSAILLVLAGYLQLIQLYDAIFFRVNESLNKMHSVIAFFQGSSDLQIAGFPPMKGHLYIKVVIQIIEHHLDSVEQLIGLPAEFHVSGHTACSSGLLGSVDASGLLQVVMERTGSDPERSGVLIAASLRANIKETKRLMQV